MKKLPLLVLLLTVFFACRREVAEQHSQLANEPAALSLITTESEKWQFEDLRLYPILASEGFIEGNTALRELKTLAEVIDTYGFRISEKKPFGRFEDAGAVNNLTVQNKTGDPVFLMGGDIVRGGRQDRVVGEDQIIAARSLQDIPVFCIEQGRWQFQGNIEPQDDIAAKQDKVFAFSGYYHVAAGDIRNTLASSKDQQEVWEKVGNLTSRYPQENHSSAYASLESSEDFTRQRDAYLRFFEGKFSELKDMVGIMAVSGDRIIGTDVFGHPDLFQRQLTALLHSYATDAVIQGSPVSVTEKQLQLQLQQANKALNATATPRYKGTVTHYFVKAQD